MVLSARTVALFDSVLLYGQMEGRASYCTDGLPILYGTNSTGVKQGSSIIVCFAVSHPPLPLGAATWRYGVNGPDFVQEGRRSAPACPDLCENTAVCLP